MSDRRDIADPNLPRERVTTENKKAHTRRNLPARCIKPFPTFLTINGKGTSHRIIRQPLSLTNWMPKATSTSISIFTDFPSSISEGAFCFITSNSWLDVGYGKDLQEFTLKHCHIKQIIDNEARRSFASADVNTVISLFSAPNEKPKSELDQTARFIMFKTPFEGVLDAVIFYEIERSPGTDE